MKKIINNPAHFVEESIDGLIKSHPDIYALAKDNNRVVMRANKASNKVGIVTGGGSGHLPVFTGYVLSLLHLQYHLQRLLFLFLFLLLPPFHMPFQNSLHLHHNFQ